MLRDRLGLLAMRTNVRAVAHIPASKSKCKNGLCAVAQARAGMRNAKRNIAPGDIYPYVLLAVVLGITLVVSICIMVSCRCCRRRQAASTLEQNRTSTGSHAVPMLANGNQEVLGTGFGPEASVAAPGARRQGDYHYRGRRIQRDGRLRMYASTVGSTESPSRTGSIIRVARPPVATSTSDRGAGLQVLLPTELQGALLARAQADYRGEAEDSTDDTVTPWGVDQWTRRPMRRAQAVQLAVRPAGRAVSYPTFEVAVGVPSDRWRFSSGSAQTHSTEPPPEYTTLPPSSPRVSLDGGR